MIYIYIIDFFEMINYLFLMHRTWPKDMVIVINRRWKEKDIKTMHKEVMINGRWITSF